MADSLRYHMPSLGFIVKGAGFPLFASSISSSTTIVLLKIIRTLSNGTDLDLDLD